MGKIHKKLFPGYRIRTSDPQISMLKYVYSLLLLPTELNPVKYYAIPDTITCIFFISFFQKNIFGRINIQIKLKDFFVLLLKVQSTNSVLYRIFIISQLHPHPQTMSLVRQNSCFQPSINNLVRANSIHHMSKINALSESPDIDGSFWTIDLEETHEKQMEEDTTFKSLSRCAKVSEAETNTAQVEHWLKAVMLTELEDFQAKKAKQIQWADTLVQAALTYSKSEYDRRGPHEFEWTRMPCAEYQDEDFIDEMAGVGISEEGPVLLHAEESKTSAQLFEELMQFYHLTSCVLT